MLFHYDWWFGRGLTEQIDEAKRRCAAKHFPDVNPYEIPADSEADHFSKELEHRVILYLRDGFTYELFEVIDAADKSYLTAQCVPGDEAYQAGVFVVAIPFEEIARVEVFAVHPSQKPQEAMHITGFARRPDTAGRPEREAPAEQHTV